LDKCTFEELIPEFQAIYPDIDTTKLYKTLEIKDPIHTDTIESYTRLCEIADIWGFKDKLQFTNSLARGLDYYSGFVWEIKWSKGVSTIISGGRYDTLINKSLVGISFGLSRIIALLDIPDKDYWEDGCYVVTLGHVNEIIKLQCIEKLRKETTGKVLYSFEKKDKKLVKVINECIENKIRYIVILAENELKDGKYIIKDLKEQTQTIKKI
jgi:histidyl-tRNA synthetase